MEKSNVERALAPSVQATLPGFPVLDEEVGRGARRRALVDRERAQRACAPMGTLQSVVVAEDAHRNRRVWYVVDPDPAMAHHYAAQGFEIAAGSRVLIDAEAMRPVALLEIDPDSRTQDTEMSPPCGFNPYWDLSPT
jgi:hypothetical protein